MFFFPLFQATFRVKVMKTPPKMTANVRNAVIQTAWGFYFCLILCFCWIDLEHGQIVQCLSTDSVSQEGDGEDTQVTGDPVQIVCSSIISSFRWRSNDMHF